MLKLFKKETRKIARVFVSPTFVYLTITGNSILLVATYGLYLLEKGINPGINCYFDSLWWGVATITTVAFGDIVPVTTYGRFIGIFLMYTGTVLYISFTGVLLTFLMHEEVEKEFIPLEKEMHEEEKEQALILKKLDQISSRLDRLEKKA